MPKKKSDAVRYRFVQTVSYAPLGDKEYPAGAVDGLVDWDAGAVQRALAAGLVEVVQDIANPVLAITEMAGKEDGE